MCKRDNILGNNITFLLDEDSNFKENESTFNINNFLNEIENEEIYNDIPHIFHYHENFTIKELMVICDYYGISKQLKKHKYKKDIIIQYLIEFETNSENHDIVSKRHNLWFYINELKNDKFMKKYLLW
jgi:hypothetical protein